MQDIIKNNMLKITQKDIIWKDEITKVPHCPECGGEMREYKDYAPYICDCGKWYVDDYDDSDIELVKNDE